ncbi:flagellar basal-body protein FlbY [Maricaulis sp.]|uniref:flagellar basal-body protein FlbY n=1 Tax=Maricaulis sp. TaxID=1486257 RepID=UPI002B271FAE|nr:flagellar basal-body protein FlbY [Maricaulis sp.]
MTELAAGNPAERAEGLLKLTRRLTDLINEETRLFQDRRPHEALVLQDEKSQLANIYRAEVARARKEPARFSGAPAPIKQALRDATTRFHESLAENGRIVGALKTVTEGVVKAIADEAARQRSTAGGYGPGASQQSGRGGNFAIAVNRTA